MRLLTTTILGITLGIAACTPDPAPSLDRAPDVAPATPSTSIEAVPYALDCGPLERSVCLDSAERLAAASERSHPGKRVRSVAYTTRCGSFELLFDDGTLVGGDVDCFIEE